MVFGSSSAQDASLSSACWSHSASLGPGSHEMEKQVMWYQSWGELRHKIPATDWGN